MEKEIKQMTKGMPIWDKLAYGISLVKGAALCRCSFRTNCYHPIHKEMRLGRQLVIADFKPLC